MRFRRMRGNAPRLLSALPVTVPNRNLTQAFRHLPVMREIVPTRNLTMVVLAEKLPNATVKTLQMPQRKSYKCHIGYCIEKVDMIK